MSSIQKISGLVAAPFTPMHDDGRLKLDIIPAYAELLQQDQVKAVFVCGSTGEGASLMYEEKIQVMQAWAGTPFSKIMLVGGTSLEECKHLARKANELGYAGVAFIAPYYFKPGSHQILADCCAEVAAAAPDLPFYYYHIPVLSGVNMSMLPLLQAVADRIPNFAGIKYTQEDLMDFAQCLQFQNERFDLLWGRDEVMLAALSMGARGAVGSTFNYAAPVYHALMDCFEKNELAKALEYQHRSIEIVRLLGKYGGIRVGKAFMRARGIDCGHFRLPIPRMSTSEYQAFLADVASIGFYDWVKPNYATI